MFEAIDYDVHYVPNKKHPTGLHLKRRHTLLPGFGAIVGPNESGKSTILELLRFSLFGSKALRGVAADYQKLDVTVWLSGDRVIHRTLTGASLTIEGETVVKGTKPVNARIVEMLGFGLAVFDVANSINQGDVEALSNMRPTERAKLTGSVVGLDKIDQLMAYTNSVALGHDRAAAAVEAVLAPPLSPPEPEGYPNRSMFHDWLDKAEKDAIERAKLEGMLSAPGAAPPVNPGPRPTELSVADLREIVANGNEHQLLTMELRRLPEAVDLDVLEADIVAYENYSIAQDWLRDHPLPTLSLEEAKAALATWDLLDRFMARKTLLDEEARLVSQLDNSETATCPSCDHTFHLEEEVAARVSERVSAVRAELEAYADVPLAVTGPSVRRAECEARIEQGEDRFAEERAAALAVPKVAPPLVKRHELDAYRIAAARRPEIEAQLATLEVDPAANETLEALLAWEIRSEGYDQRVAYYEQQQQERARLKAAYDALEYPPGRLEELRRIVGAFKPYEQALARFETDQAAYELRLAQVAEMRAKAEQWRAAKDALADLRTQIKQHLYPSLAKAASVLLAGMTNGARRSVEIDEDFDVLIDGQRIDTLSGSAKAVANLSIRLGLGQVLTHRVFPVIFADEIDASMDDDRANSTQEMLYQCARRVSQFLMVSHKTPAADWYIDLGEVSE